MEAQNPRGHGCFYLLSALFGALVGIIAGALVVSLIFFSFLGYSFKDLVEGKSVTSPSNSQKIEIKSFYKDPVSAVATKVRPSVVSLRVEKIEVAEDFFFGPFYRRVRGIGSGVIFRSDGYILTNNHVVSGADRIWVTLYDGEEIRGKVVGRDPENDIAVVKIEKENLPAADLGSVKDVRVGDLAVAIGSPFGFDYTVTAGVISALNRTISTQDESGNPLTLTDMIQTDAAINPGNSGGALCNKDGKVIGINTLIYTRSEGFQGIGFAIPIDTAVHVAEQLISRGKVEHPFIGITGTSLTSEMRAEGRYPVKKGAVVVQVLSGTPADKAGLRRGDIIIEFDGKKIKSMDDLVSEVRKKKVGEKVEITIVRGKKRLTLELTIGEKTDYLAP
jgi:S1-C subfamily serine protease